MSHKHAKYKLGIVTWHDAFAIADNHIDDHDSVLHEPFVRYSTGWILKRRPMVLAQTFDHKGVGSTLTIPNGMVKNITILEVIENE